MNWFEMFFAAAILAALFLPLLFNVQAIKEMICAWRGHDEEEYVPSSLIDLRPGHINYMPTTKLITHLPVPEMPPPWILAMLPEERRNDIVQKVMMLRLNPPIILRHHYCTRCGEAW